MDAKIALEIQTAAFKSAQDIVKAQIAKGSPNHGMPKDRHLAVVADVSIEMLESYGKTGDTDEDTKYNREVLRAAYTGSLLNDSALRQDLEGKGDREVIFVKSTPLTGQYGV